MSQKFNLSWCHQDRLTGANREQLELSFAAPESSAELAAQVQKFLNAVGYPNIEVVVATAAADWGTAGDQDVPWFWSECPPDPWWKEPAPDFAPARAEIPRFLRKDVNESGHN